MDIGDVEEPVNVPNSSTAASQGNSIAQFHNSLQADLKEASDFAILAADPEDPPIATRSIELPVELKDSRIAEIVSLLAEYMPSDPHTAAANYLSGFMSLRLLLLREIRSPEEEQLVRTILESYTSYLASDRERADIAIMLARDYIFLSQQQQNSFFGFSQGILAPGAIQAGDNSGLSLFGLPSTNSSLQNSPALTPIPAPGLIDSMSIVST